MSGDDGDGDDGDGGGARQDETEFDFAIFITDVAVQSRQNVSSTNTISFIFSQPRLFDVVRNVATRPLFSFRLRCIKLDVTYLSVWFAGE